MRGLQILISAKRSPSFIQGKIVLISLLLKAMITSKAGINWPIQEGSSDPVAKFFQTGSLIELTGERLSWHWNWNKNWDVLLPQTTPGLQINAEFVPMIFAPNYLHNEFTLQPGWHHILGYNEPDHHDSSVAQQTTPALAAKGWKDICKLRTSPEIKLVSPAVAFDLNWMKEFLSLLPIHEKPDYLAIHVYTTTFESFRSIVENYWKTFEIPIWVTEFAMQSFDANVPPPSSLQQVHDFMGQTTKWLDETDYIVRYSWFGAVRNPANLHGVHPFNRLMDEHGNITPLGHQYINGGHD